MKKGIIIVMIMIFSFITVHADSGPKPSIYIDIQGLSQQNYYVTLLSQSQSTGPYSVYDGYSEDVPYQKDTKDYHVWEKMKDYQDSDHFYFLQYFQDCSKTNTFEWNYFPPETFKILIYFIDTDEWIVSDIYTKTEFHATYSITVSNDHVIHLAYDYSSQIMSFIQRIAITLVVELLIALLFQIVKNKQWLVLLLTNIITQLLLNFMLYVFQGVFMFGLIVLYFIIEGLIIFIENKIYQTYLTAPTKVILTYTIIANISSFIIGLIVL